MTDPLLDDVKSLLDKDFGDDRILKQICRACENDEVISNYERNYVRKLAEKHLGRQPEIIPSNVPVQEKPVVPDVPLSENLHKSQLLQTKSLRKSNSKNSKLMLGVGGLALVIIIAIGVSFTGISSTSPVEIPINSVTDTLSVQTDFSSYVSKDLISIHGNSNVSGSVDIVIENQSGELIWSEQVPIKNNGSYSTLTIAGGPGWLTSGTYTISVTNSEETRTSSFLFST